GGGARRARGAGEVEGCRGPQRARRPAFDGARVTTAEPTRLSGMNAAESLVVGVEKLVDIDAHEGPVYVADEHALYFTSVPRPRPYVAVRRLDLATLKVTTLLDGANAANGMTLDPYGQLLVCEQGTRMSDARISRLDLRTGSRRTVVDSYRGLPLNSPNDIVVARDGS